MLTFEEHREFVGRVTPDGNRAVEADCLNTRTLCLPLPVNRKYVVLSFILKGESVCLILARPFVSGALHPNRIN